MCSAAPCVCASVRLRADDDGVAVADDGVARGKEYCCIFYNKVGFFLDNFEKV